MFSEIDSLITKGYIATAEDKLHKIINDDKNPVTIIHDAMVTLSSLYIKVGLVELARKYLPPVQVSGRRYLELFSNPYKQGENSFLFSKKFNEPKIAFVSSDWIDHPCEKFLDFVNWVPNSIKIDINPNRSTSVKTVKELVDALRDIDVIVDCNGYTKFSKTFILKKISERSGKRLVSYLGYPVPIDGIEFIEQASFDDSFFLCYKVPEIPVEIKYEPTEDLIVFGYFARLEKMSDQTVKFFYQLITETLLIGKRPLIRIRSECFVHNQVRDLFLKRLSIHCDFHDDFQKYFELVPGTKNYYESFNQIDYLIDSYPYSGTTVTCDALYMGVPILVNPILEKLEFDQFSEHVTVTSRLLKFLNLKDISKNPKDFSKNRQEIRSEFIKKVCDPRRFAKDFYNLFKQNLENKKN